MTVAEAKKQSKWVNDGLKNDLATWLFVNDEQMEKAIKRRRFSIRKDNWEIL